MQHRADFPHSETALYHCGTSEPWNGAAFDTPSVQDTERTPRRLPLYHPSGQPWELAPLHFTLMSPAPIIKIFQLGTGVPPEVLQSLLGVLGKAFHLPVTTAHGCLPLHQQAYDPWRKQWRAAELVGQLAASPSATNSDGASSSGGIVELRLGVAAVDLCAPGLNFVFGEASYTQRCAVFSTARLQESAHPHAQPAVGPNSTLFARHCATEAVHELGHAMGLAHCRRPTCAMYFSNTLADTDLKGWRLCKSCQQALASHMQAWAGVREQ